MGKVRNARRNPGLTWDELRFAQGGDTVTHRGDNYVVHSNGKRGSHAWVLRSSSGVRYHATVGEDGQVFVDLIGLMY